MKKYILGFVSILLLVAVSGCFREGGERMQKKLSKELSLNDSQKKALQLSFKKLDELQKQSKNVFKAMSDVVVQEVKKDRFNANSASKSIQSQMDQLSKMVPAYMDALASFHKTLDAEQKQKLGDLAEKLKSRKEHRRKGRKHNKDDDDNKGGY